VVIADKPFFLEHGRAAFCHLRQPKTRKHGFGGSQKIHIQETARELAETAWENQLFGFCLENTLLIIFLNRL
jgi:hypothetical protein